MSLPSTRILLEVCVDSFSSAQRALDNGADRLEICGPLATGGGTSPSFALVRQIRAAYPHAALMVMVRPRPGDFVYSTSEIGLMLDEIDFLRTVEPPIQGVVVGCLRKDGSVDLEATRTLVDRARPLSVTFHRAFDMTWYPPPSGTETSLVGHAIQALDAIQSVPGISRILTSALGSSLPPSFDLFRQMVTHNASLHSPLILLPGSGLNPTSLRSPVRPLSTQLSAAGSSEEPSIPPQTLLEAMYYLGIREVHASCSSMADGPVEPRARRERMGMGGWERWEVDPAVVKEMRALLDGLASRAAEGQDPPGWVERGAGGPIPR